MNGVPYNGTNTTLADPGNSAADKLLRALSAFRQQPSWDVAALAVHLNLPKSTTHRLLQDLRRHGYVRQLAGSSRYTLGYQLAVLANSLNPSSILRDVVRPGLEYLANITGETASFVVLDNLNALVLEVAESPSALRFALSAGTRFPLYRGSAGRVFLAFEHESLAQAILGQLDKANRAALKRDVAQVRQQGWAYTSDEVNLGAAAIAVPVFAREGGLVGCLAAGGPVARMGLEAAQKLLPALNQQAQIITRELA